MEDIPHTYFMPYHALIYSNENPVEEALKTLGGKPATQRNFRGVDTIDDSFPRQFEYWFAEYEFPIKYSLKTHSIKVFLTGEIYPQPLPRSKRITGTLIRVRLGNYDLRDKLTYEISDKLSEISEQALDKYPKDMLKDLMRFT